MQFIRTEIKSPSSTQYYKDVSRNWQPGHSFSNKTDHRHHEHRHHEQSCNFSGEAGRSNTTTATVNSGGFTREMYRAAINSRVGRLDLSGMSEFKQGVIRRTLSQYRRVAQDEPVPDPSRQFSMEYNAEKDELHVGSIQVIINDTTSSLQCSQCSFRSELMSPKKASFTEYRMFYHILVKHLQVFRCSSCGANKHNYKSYAHHLTDCQKMGYRINTEKKVGNISSPIKPRNKNIPNAVDRPFQCGTCGKKFIQKANLRSHEEVHEVSNVTNQKPNTNTSYVTCPGCGKIFSEQNFKYAHRKICRGLAGW